MNPDPKAEPDLPDGAGIEGGETAGQERRRRGGRPPLAEAEQRRHKVTVSLNERERALVEAKAVRAGLPVAAYLRAAGAGRRLDRRINDRVYHQLARIGVNVNQMARVANASGRLPELERLRTLSEDLLEMRRRL